MKIAAVVVLASQLLLSVFAADSEVTLLERKAQLR
jgi:hypothetical protein